MNAIADILNKYIKGEEERKKVNFYTKVLTLALATVEAVGIYISYSKSYSTRAKDV